MRSGRTPLPALGWGRAKSGVPVELLESGSNSLSAPQIALGSGDPGGVAKHLLFLRVTRVPLGPGYLCTAHRPALWYSKFSHV